MDDLENYIKELGGIQPPHLAFYSQAIRFNVESAMVSIEALASFIEMTNDTKGDYEMTGELQDSILDHLQNLLVHAGALSRYFWPSKPGKHDLHKHRAETLKKHFGLTDESPLKSRKLRNQLEHFDENLDKYLWAKPIVGHVLPAYVGEEIESGGVPAHLFRAFYLDNGVYETLGVRHEVQPIVDEVCYLYQRFHGEPNT
ncbi:hypothetical protein [Neptunomonas phycophila]|uniref:hypothetical protein n=1 Tax=Neptunomonas phycophila TaxID=1572645 RepID=UPI0009488DE3|nr:hypothetical protein [Neptunomonas phycophila]